jgi:hypothetical protein
VSIHRSGTPKESICIIAHLLLAHRYDQILTLSCAMVSKYHYTGIVEFEGRFFKLLSECCQASHSVTTVLFMKGGAGFNCPHEQEGLKRWDTIGSLQSGETISLPANTKVLLSGCMVNRAIIYKKIIVPETSELVIADAPMYWRIGQLDIRGKLRIGSETCRTQNSSVCYLL